MADIRLTPDAANEFEKLPRPIQGRVTKLFERLGHWPNVSGAKPLSGPLAGRYRLRTGDYRVQFRVVGESVVIERIGHRNRFYEGQT